MKTNAHEHAFRIATEARADLLDRAAEWAAKAAELDEQLLRDRVLLSDVLDVLGDCERVVYLGNVRRRIHSAQRRLRDRLTMAVAVEVSDG